MSQIDLTNEGIVVDGKLMGKWEEIDHFEVNTGEVLNPKSKFWKVAGTIVSFVAPLESNAASYGAEKGTAASRVLTAVGKENGGSQNPMLFNLDVTPYFQTNKLKELISQIEGHGPKVQSVLPLNKEDVPTESELSSGMKKQMFWAWIILILMGLLIFPIIYFIWKWLGLN